MSCRETQQLNSMNSSSSFQSVMGCPTRGLWGTCGPDGYEYGPTQGPLFFPLHMYVRLDFLPVLQPKQQSASD